ncbi:4747_t:CDS:2 [Paraglomus occultum]|uniref:4747_t:CDS:1 n=1 Tax=Paraglomus occultum TaxID=144539 RepID=A0A9N9F409_9GLOM|nr:4747_t:CDS:2 [Paraglomus occultum]
MSRVPGKRRKVSACLTTTIYGQTYLDPEKCKARGFEPIKAAEEEIKGIHWAEWIERRTEEIGFCAQFEEFLAKFPPEFVNKDRDPKSLDCLDDTPIPKKRNKSDKKPSTKISICEVFFIDQSFTSVNHKIKLEDGFYVKVIAVKMNKDNVFLEVEEKVGDKLEYYEIEYQQDMVGL